jgi:SAM-dependent methyltransferase
LIFLSPVPTDLGRYYPTEYYEVPKNERDLAARAEKLQSVKLDVLQRFATKGSLLEIGPAYGLFAFLAKRAGFDVTGIEMDARCCDFLRSSVGIKVVEGSDPRNLLATLPKFDVIVLWQVIEHLPDPWAVLKAAALHLAPGGVLIVDTPNPDAFQFKIFGARWTHVDAPRHVTLIPSILLEKFALQQGLKSINISANGAISRGYNSFGWAFSLKNFFDTSTAGSIAHLFGRFLNKLMIPIERLGMRGSTYTAVFRKDFSQ